MSKSNFFKDTSKSGPLGNNYILQISIQTRRSSKGVDDTILKHTHIQVFISQTDTFTLG